MPKRARKSTVLDCLPTNLQERIAEFVSGGRPRPSALLLAEVSKAQRDAVLHVLHHRHIVGDCDTSRWAGIFAGSIREIKVPQYHSAIPQLLLALLRSEALRVAELPATTEFLSALQHHRSVQELSILLVDEDHDELLRALQDLRLKKLRVHCDPHEHPLACVSGLFDRLGQGALASACPRLQFLEISCPCGAKLQLPSILENFKFLRCVSLATELFEEDVQALRSMESVVLDEVYCEPFTAAKIGPAVTSFVADHSDLYDKTAIENLKNCGRLEHLSLPVAPGLEEPIAALMSSLPQLESLSLEWDLVNDRYESPRPGTILQMIQALPQLEKLVLNRVCISMTELSSVLRRFGPRLKVFGTSISGQREPAHERLLDVMLALSRYNRSLTQLHITDELRSSAALNACHERDKWIRKLSAAQNVLMRHAPRVNELSLSYCIRAVTR